VTNWNSPRFWLAIAGAAAGLAMTGAGLAYHSAAPTIAGIVWTAGMVVLVGRSRS
jgi:hypothetical protein